MTGWLLFCWSLCCSWGLAAFRCTRRWASGWPGYARVGFAACAIVYAADAARGEVLYREALRQSELSGVLVGTLRAAAVHPLSARIRESNAAFYGQFGQLMPHVALLELRRALHDSPNQPGLLALLTVTLLRTGDTAQARETASRLALVAPDWPPAVALRTYLFPEEGSR